MIQIEICHLCGYVTDRHLIHAAEDKIYCVSHYLLHILNNEIETLVQDEDLDHNLRISQH